jgi:hypothetical protein
MRSLPNTVEVVLSAPRYLAGNVGLFILFSTSQLELAKRAYREIFLTSGRANWMKFHSSSGIAAALILDSHRDAVKGEMPRFKSPQTFSFFIPRCHKI